jgi:hypothetical protein
MDPDRSGDTPLQPPLSQLERALIEEFLRSRGCDPAEVPHLPPEQRHELLTQASRHASARMAEVEARSHYLHDIHDAEAPRTRPGHQ